MWALTPVRRFIGYSLLGVFVPIVLALVALPVGALLGVFPADFVHVSGFQETLSEQVEDPPYPGWTLAEPSTG